MHLEPKKIFPIVLAVLLVVGTTTYLILRTSAGSGALTASGTIEATEIHLGTEQGGKVDRVTVKEGEAVEPGQVLVEVRPSANAAGPAAAKERITSPIAGLVLERSVEPGEIASPNAILLTVADLDALTLTIYVPEDRYGKISLGQTYQVKVDSYSGESFPAVVTHIADQAEFTPRNVQTADSRKTTVYAIKLELAPSGGKLKPGMPADVELWK